MGLEIEGEGATVKQYNGFDDAIVGIGRRCGEPEMLIYSEDKVLTILMERDGMSREEAREHYLINIREAYINEDTPIFMTDKEPET
jgi:hypothetical protein